MLMWREDKELSKYNKYKAKMGQVASMLALLARSLGFCWGDCTCSRPLACTCIGFACILGWRESRVVTVVTPCMCLGGTKMQIGEVKSHGSQVDKLRGQANESRGQADALTVLNTCKMVAMSDGGGTDARSDAEGVRHCGAEPDGHASRLDMSSGHVDMPNIRNDMNMTADTKETISTVPQMQNLPVNAGRYNEVEPRSCMDVPSWNCCWMGNKLHEPCYGHHSLST